jgi:hypothetical protein
MGARNLPPSPVGSILPYLWPGSLGGPRRPGDAEDWGPEFRQVQAPKRPRTAGPQDPESAELTAPLEIGTPRIPP